ncbi:hypothetical protein LTR66_011551 [Elasticomyces elasticus]|nr:hypothetical protein LTR66_011551 [Elasticomyces elasticus]
MLTVYQYIDELGNLATATFRRGRLFHSEMNQPVVSALQALAAAVHGYGTDLTSKHVIYSNATIRTITAGSGIVQAESSWGTNQNYPG